MSHNGRPPRPRNLSPPPPASTPSPFRFVVRKPPSELPPSSTQPTPSPSAYRAPISTFRNRPSGGNDTEAPWPASTPRFVVRKKQEEEIEEDELARRPQVSREPLYPTGRRYREDETPRTAPRPGVKVWSTPFARRQYEDDDSLEQAKAITEHSGQDTIPTSSFTPRQAKRPRLQEDILTFSDDEDYAPTLPATPAISMTAAVLLSGPASGARAIAKFLPTTRITASTSTTIVYSPREAFSSIYTIAEVGDVVVAGGRFVLACARDKALGRSHIPDSEDDDEEENDGLQRPCTAIVLLRGQSSVLKAGALIGINEGVTVSGVVGTWSGVWKVTGKWGFVKEDG